MHKLKTKYEMYHSWNVWCPTQPVRHGPVRSEVSATTRTGPDGLFPTRPVSGDSKVSERTGNPGNLETGPDQP